MTEKVWITKNVSNEAIRRARAILAHQDGPISDQCLRDMYIRCVQDMMNAREAVLVTASARDGYEDDHHFAMKSEVKHERIPYILKFIDASKVMWITKNTWPSNIRTTTS